MFLQAKETPKDCQTSAGARYYSEMLKMQSEQMKLRSKLLKEKIENEQLKNFLIKRKLSRDELRDFEKYKEDGCQEESSEDESEEDFEI